MQRGVVGAASGVLILIAGLVPANANDIVKANSQVTLDLIGTNVNYLETVSGSGLDSENGWVPGISFTASSMKDLYGVHDLYTYGQVSLAYGTTSYWAAGGPVTQNTDGALLFDADFRVGKGFETGANFMVTPYIGAGWHSWDRDLSNAPGPYGYHEKYSNGYAGAGVLLQAALTDRLVVSGDALLGTTLGSGIQGGPNGGAAITPFSAALGNSLMLKLGLSADYAISNRIHLNAGVDYTHFSYGASAPFCIGPIGGPCPNAIEPDSSTSYVTARIGVGVALP